MGKADVFAGLKLSPLEKLIFLKRMKGSGGGGETYEDRTATGNPVIFTTNFIQNVKALSIIYTPQQDLNGQTRPWVAGQGKNLVGEGNLTWGKSLNTSGVVVDYTANRCATVNPIMIDNTKSYVFSTASADVRLIYAIFNGETLVRRTSGTSGTALNVSGGDRIYLCFYSYDSTRPSGQQYDFRKVLADEDKIQFEQNSAATAYEPYENVCPISGAPGLSINRTNKNLCPSYGGTAASSSNGISYTYNDDGSITANGTATATSYSQSSRFDLKAGSYKKSQGLLVQEVVSPTYWTVIASESATEFTIASDIHALVRLKFSSGETVNNKFYPYIYPASITDMTYEEQVIESHPYTLPSGIDAVYSGSFNVKTGALTIDRIKIPISDASMLPEGSNGWKTGTNANRIGFAIDTALLPRQNDSLDILCNIGYASADANSGNGSAFASGACSLYKGNACMYFRFCVPKSIDNVDDAYTYLKNNGCEVVVPLDTPLSYSLTPSQVSLIEGYNVIASDGGEIRVEYQVKV